jgi:hypothetical protein
MKKLKLLSTILGLSVLASVATAGSLKDIELDEDFNSACVKVNNIFKNNKQIEIKKDIKKCGFFNIMLMSYIGVESNDGTTVDVIRLPVNVFGLDMMDKAESHMKKYVKSSGSPLTIFEKIENGNSTYYEAYIIYGQYSITIDDVFITMQNKSSEEPVDFR